jgi:hypothetical protein
LTIRFCFFCGTGYNRDDWIQDFDCSECTSVFTPPILKRVKQLMLIEAIQSFSTKPLTDKKAKQAEKRRLRDERK